MRVMILEQTTALQVNPAPLGLAAEIPSHPVYSEYLFEDANCPLCELNECKMGGTKVLRVSYCCSGGGDSSFGDISCLRYRNLWYKRFLMIITGEGPANRGLNEGSFTLSKTCRH